MDPLLDRIAAIRQHQQGGARAPHKPLLLLWALARVLRGEGRLARWTEMREPLAQLLHDFGRPGQKPSPSYPFWRLRGDGLWVVEHEAELAGTESASGDVRVGALNELDPGAGFDEATWQALRADPALAHAAAAQLLEDNFPHSLHEDILAAVGMPAMAVDGAEAATRRRRDPAFKAIILEIYEYRCAVCGYDGRLKDRVLGLEAAHVKWHACDGPDAEDNGLALCAFHHRVFDSGALGLDDDLTLLVSRAVNGSEQTHRLLIDYLGAPLRGPQPGAAPVRVEYAQWHRAEVFQRPPRVAG